MAHNPLSKWGQLYVGSVILAGAAAIGHSAYSLYAQPIGWNWFVLAILTLISGSATVKLPSVPATISISETFVFTSVLLFGPAAGTLTVALDALVISLWLARRGHPLYRIAFNVCALPAALWLSAHLFYYLGPDGLRPLSVVTDPIRLTELLRPLVFFTIAYFLLNSWLIAIAISFERRLSPFHVWRGNFAWLALNYFGGASIAALLVTYTRNIDYTYLAFVMPLLAVLYVTFAVTMGRVEDANRHLTQLNSLYMSTIETLAMAIDAKDQITHGHIRRVQHFAVGLAQVMGVKDPEQISAIEAASLLHDMGKLAVPEYILNKPGPLTAAEFQKMKLHASVGADILSSIPFPYPVVPIVRHHHENWDGTGYPDGLRGSQIPIGARILSVVDCFDALTSDRPYRPRLSDDEAMKILLERRGSMYDPLVVDSFLAVHSQIAPPPEDHEHGRAGLKAIAQGVARSDYPNAASQLEQIAASTEETLVLYDLARGLSGRIDLGDAADVISKHLRRIVPPSTCVFYIYDSVTDELVANHSSGDNASHFSGVRIPRGQRLTGWVAANRQTIVNSDPILDLGDPARALKPRLMSCLSTPLIAGADLVGVLSLYASPRNAFSDDHRRILEAVAKQVSRTVKQAVDFRDSRNQNLRDRLTDLPTATQLQDFVAAEIAGASDSSSLSIIFIDCESQRSIVRVHGTEVAEEAMNRLAETIRRSMRGTDVLFRHSVDEFVALLLQTEAEVAEMVASRIVESIARERFFPSGIEDSLGRVRLGVATAPSDGTTVQELVARARQRGSSGPSRHSERPGSIH